MFENDVPNFAQFKKVFFFFFSKGREAALPLSEKAHFKCVSLYPIIMPADKGNTNTLCIKGA